MSITDELRECIATAIWQYENDVKTAYIPKDKLTAIADRIDAEHEAACTEAYGNGVMSVPIALDESQWVKLPVDADGVPIHAGDELTNGTDLPAKVRGMVLDESGWTVSAQELRGYGVLPATLRHVQPDSWERIIKDALTADRGDAYAVSTGMMCELVERCRRLAHDGR